MLATWTRPEAAHLVSRTTLRATHSAGPVQDDEADARQGRNLTKLPIKRFEVGSNALKTGRLAIAKYDGRWRTKRCEEATRKRPESREETPKEGIRRKFTAPATYAAARENAMGESQK
jgi:hypothetical protein